LDSVATGQQSLETGKQLIGQGATSAAILQFHNVGRKKIQCRLRLWIAAILLDQFGVDIDGRHIIDNHTHTTTVGIFQYVFENGRFARSQETGQ
jgi:hypothetical protein